jgi:Haem-binding domain
MRKIFFRRAGVAALALLGIMQLVPYGGDHTNPPARVEPQWDSAPIRELTKRACFDCHSNETRWPWYSNIAPVSWLVQNDVNEGRAHLNFSEWNRPQKHAKDATEEVRQGGMPLWYYVPLHAEARLTASEKEMLIRGLEATASASERHSDDDKRGEGTQ